jgi:hypothetical protein
MALLYENILRKECRPLGCYTMWILEERITSIIRVTRIGELGTTLAVTSSVLQLPVTANVPSSLVLVTLIMEVIRSSEMSVHARAT